MKAADVVLQLNVLLPQLTNLFTNEVAVTSLSRSGSIMTALCDEKHDLTAGDAVAISGAVTQIVVTMTRSEAIGTAVSATDHDLTTAIAPTVTFSGATESEFVGTFTVLTIPNRRTITFTMADAGPTTATGSPVIEGAESALRDYNTTYAVLETPTVSSFTFTEPATTLADPSPTSTIVARSKPRVSAGISIERCVDAYTAQADGEYWLFVVLADVEASKNRKIGSDAVDNLTHANEFRQQITQPFSVFVFIPVTGELAARLARDQVTDLFPLISRCVLFHKFDSGLTVGAQGAVQFVSHEIFDYNTAVYVHGFNYQQTVDLILEDTVGPDLDVAFRNIDLTLIPQLNGTGTLTASAIDLDDTPLP